MNSLDLVINGNVVMTLTIMAPTIIKAERMIVMHKLTIKIIFTAEGEIQSSKILKDRIFVVISKFKFQSSQEVF